MRLDQVNLLMSFAGKINGLLNSNPKEFIYWTRLILAIIAAVLCVISKLDIDGLIIGAVFYLFSCVLFCYTLKTEMEKLDGKYKLYTTGLGSYLAMWITVWSLLHTYLV